MPEAGRTILALEAGHHPLAPAFSDPTHTEQDAAHLRAMLGDLRGALERPTLPPTDGRRFIFQEAALRHGRPLAVVGFRGYRRADVSPDLSAAVDAADADLVERLSRGPDLLSYSCSPLPSGDWINLVVLRDAAAVQAWHADPAHRHASQHLAPQFYSSVRLHSGVLPQGVDGPLLLTGTRYYDFSGERPWYAQRRFGAN